MRTVDPYATLCFLSILYFFICRKCHSISHTTPTNESLGSGFSEEWAFDRFKSKEPASFFSKWLKSLVVSIPDIDFELENGARGYLHDLVCTDFGIGSIDSNYVLPDALLIGLNFVSASCDGMWHLQYGFVSGTGGVKISTTESNLQLGVYLPVQREQGHNLKWIEKVVIRNCMISFKVQDLSFTGGLSAMLNLFANLITTIIERQVDSEVCPGVESFINRNLSLALTNLGEWLEDISQYQAEPIILPEQGNEVFDWKDSTVLTTVNALIQSTVKENCIIQALKPFMKCTDMCCSIYPLAVNSSVAFAFDSMAGNLTISINDIEVSGVQNIQNLEILKPTGNRSLEMSIVFGAMNFSATASLEVNMEDGPIAGNDLSEDFHLRLLGSEFESQAQVILDINQSDFSTLSLGQISQPECVAQTIMFANVSNFALNFSIQSFQIEPLSGATLEDDLDGLINVVLEYTLQKLQQTMQVLVSNYLNGQVKDKINNSLKTWLGAEVKRKCTPKTPASEKDIVSFNHSIFLHWISIIGANITPENINGMISCQTQNIYGEPGLWIIGSEIFQDYLPRTSSFWFKDIYLAGLNTFRVFNPIEVISSHQLSSHLALDKLQLGINLEFGVGKALYLDDNRIRNSSKVSIHIDLSQLDFVLLTYLLMDMNVLEQLTISQLHKVSCILESMNSANISALNLSMSNLVLSSKDVIFSIDHVGPKFHGIGTHPLFEAIDQLLSRLLIEAPNYCSGVEPPRNSQELQFPLTESMLWALVGLLGVGVVAIMHIQLKGERTLSLIEIDSTPFLDSSTNLDDPSCEFQNKGTQHFKGSLFAHPKLPRVAKFGIPLVLIMNISLFLWSNTSIGASVHLLLRISRDGIGLPSLFDFSLVNTVRHMWHARVYVLALLIAIFSGIWPYLKLLLLLLCWTAGSNFLEIRARERLLMWLDMLGKWSLIDAYVLVMMMVAFRFHVDAEFIPLNFDVYVQADWGFHSFLFATILSLVLTHIIIMYHRRPVVKMGIVQESLKKSINKETKVALCNRAFCKRNIVLRFTAVGKAAITSLLLGILALLVVGSTLDCLEFDFEGAAGLVLGESSRRVFTVFTLGDAIPQCTIGKSGIGIKWIQAVYFLFVFVMPVLFLGLLLVVWILPLTVDGLDKMYKIGEILNAWGAADVLILSIVAAVLEISTFAKFMVGDRCIYIDSILKQYQTELELENGNATCFSLVTKVCNGFWVMLSGVVGWVFVGGCVKHFIHQSLAMLKAQESGSVPKDEYSSLQISKAKNEPKFSNVTYEVDETFNEQSFVEAHDEHNDHPKIQDLSEEIQTENMDLSDFYSEDGEVRQELPFIFIMLRCIGFMCAKQFHEY